MKEDTLDRLVDVDIKEENRKEGKTKALKSKAEHENGSEIKFIE